MIERHPWIIGTTVGSATWYVTGTFPLKAVILGWFTSLLLMWFVGKIWQRTSSSQLERSSVIENLATEAPEKCPDCGASLYIADRDNNNLCDDCWARKEFVTFEEDQQRGVEELKQRKKLQEEISHRGLFND